MPINLSIYTKKMKIPSLSKFGETRFVSSKIRHLLAFINLYDQKNPTSSDEVVSQIDLWHKADGGARLISQDAIWFKSENQKEKNTFFLKISIDHKSSR